MSEEANKVVKKYDEFEKELYKYFKSLPVDLRLTLEDVREYLERNLT